MMLSRLRVSISFVAVLAAQVASQSVLVVDDDGGRGVAFKDIAPALAAARSGDTILVRSGRYGVTTFPDKDLTVVADTNATVDLAAARIENLSPGRRIVLRGLRLRAGGSALAIQNCAGHVWIGDCQITGTPMGLLPGVGIRVSNAKNVTLQRCSIRAEDSNSPFGAAPGLTCATSTVWMFDTTIVGAGPLVSSLAVRPGGAGLLVQSGTVYAQRSRLVGGPGGPATKSFGNTCVAGGTGGAGVLLNGAGARFEHLDTQLVGGAGGKPNFNCPRGRQGPPITVVAGTVRPLPGRGYRLRAGGPVREAALHAMRVDGAAGHALVLAVSNSSKPTWTPPLRGPILIDPGYLTVLPLGVLPPSGSLTASLRIPELGGTVQVGSVFLQVFGFGANQSTTAGGAAALVLLDRRF